MIRIAQASGPGAPVLLLVAWLLVARRVAPGVEEHREGFDVLSRQPFARLGVREVVLPWCERWRREPVPLPQAVADLLTMTVDQHLRTAWSRLAADARRDVAVLVTDGDQWAYRKSFRPGRTNSRLGQARGWLNQLGLLDEGRLTVLGREILERTTRVLNRGGSK